MPGWLSPWELLILLAVVLLVFGPKRLPEMGRGLGKGMREFKDSITGKDEKKAAAQQLAAAAEQGQAAEAPTPAGSSAPRDRDSVA